MKKENKYYVYVYLDPRKPGKYVYGKKLIWEKLLMNQEKKEKKILYLVFLEHQKQRKKFQRPTKERNVLMNIGLIVQRQNLKDYIQY